MANTGLSSAAQRIKREVNEIIQEDVSKSGISVETTEDNFMKLKGKIFGPLGTPYEGGNYILEIQVPDGYPFNPVKVRFLTKIWHPNISSFSGEVFLNILNQDWFPYITLRTVLLSIRALLSAADPDNPQDAVVAKQYTENEELFKSTAKYWSQVYALASGSNPEFDRKIRNLSYRGADEETALVALSSSFWNVGKAFVYLQIRKKILNHQ